MICHKSKPNQDKPNPVDAMIKGLYLEKMLLISRLKFLQNIEGCPLDVMVKTMDCGIIAGEFILQSYYYIPFRGNTLGKGMKPPYPPRYRLNSTTTVLLGEWLWH